MKLFAVTFLIGCWAIHGWSMNVQIHLADRSSPANGRVVGIPVSGEINADGRAVPGYAEFAVPYAWNGQFQFISRLNADFATQIDFKLRSSYLPVAISFEPYGPGSMWELNSIPGIDITGMQDCFMWKFVFSLRPRLNYQVILPTKVSGEQGLSPNGVLECRNPYTGLYDLENRVINVFLLPSTKDPRYTETVGPPPLFGKYNLRDEVTVMSLTAEGQNTVKGTGEIKYLWILNPPYLISIGEKRNPTATPTAMQIS